MQTVYYSPIPPVVVANWEASGGDNAIERLCAEKNVLCVPVRGEGVFAPGIGRNRAFEASTTSLVCFCDVDFFMERDFFARVALLSEVLGWETRDDLMVNLPVFHLNERYTEEFFSTSQPEEKSRYLARLHEKCLFATNDTCLFAVPYSNVFICHRNGFDRSGGFNENFHGHGSEDFEFLLRFAKVIGRWPMPHFFDQDLYAPHKKQFFESRGYLGFRRLFEAMSFPAESNGFRAFHMFHPVDRAEPWMREKDRRRTRFHREVNKWARGGMELIQPGWLRRQKTVLVKMIPPALKLPPNNVHRLVENSYIAGRLGLAVQKGWLAALAVLVGYRMRNMVSRMIVRINTRLHRCRERKFLPHSLPVLSVKTKMGTTEREEGTAVQKLSG